MAEDPYADRRRFPRCNTGDDYRVRVRYNGHVMERAALKNISGSGCAIQVHLEEAPSLEVGVTIEQIILVHPDLPFVPLQGTVMWVLGKHATKTSGAVVVGVDFSPITPFMQELIDGHVTAQARL